MSPGRVPRAREAGIDSLPGEVQVAKSPVAVGMVWSLCLRGLERACPWDPPGSGAACQSWPGGLLLEIPLRYYGSGRPRWYSKNEVGTAFAHQRMLR